MQPLKLVFLFIFLIIPLSSTASSKTNSNINTIAINNIKLSTLTGGTTSLNDIKDNKPVYLKFWATWCQPCRKQMPHFQAAYEKYANDISFIAVNIGINDSPQAITKTIDEFNLTMPIAIDKSGQLFQAFNGVATPYHVLLDSKGNVIFKGNEASKQLDETIALLAKNTIHSLPTISLIKKNNTTTSLIGSQSNKRTALFFTSTWCDWYLETSRPGMSKNCISAQKQINKLSKQFSEINWIGVVSQLWTGKKELTEYKKKYTINYPLVIDTNGNEQVKYNVTLFPTLIIFDNKNEVFRISNFNQTIKLIKMLDKLK